MTESKLEAKIVRVEVRDGKNGMFYAYSNDIRGLMIAESSREAVLREIPRVLVAMYAACGENIIVVPARRDNETEWVKIPSHLARAGLDRAAA